ncbi:hypothetical protein Phi17218_109 [Cellulophaga phage phi17:2_18]|uniref:Uncharacterized protein n=2 Tax=Lightbulbvirus Cba172 TaxID=1918525 RepID=R9ZZF2_9CAUD|nr:hypothetical protein Phi17:2_gp109 [Cellulophaga phage phi17:2]AGO47642.1 hypothetical protein Phi17:2_gp109 [Cellulophaga phage phi17:2]ALO80512.1 hypothetical protein Phi17218_109 [Cellulophaga phage phi17:2_18]
MLSTLVNYCLTPGTDHYIEFERVFSAIRFFVQHKKNFYFYQYYVEEVSKPIKIKPLKCEFKPSKNEFK